MPAYSTLRDFISALQTGNTNITRVLQYLANSADMKSNPDAIRDINTMNSFNTLPGWFVDACTQNGMSQPEITHIGDWPPAQKEIVRNQIAAVWATNDPIEFSWELHEGNFALSQVRRTSLATLRVVFLSPRQGVHLDSFFRVGEVKVDV